MTDFAAAPRTVPVIMNDTWTLQLPPHRARQWANPWEKERLLHMRANIYPGDVVLDCGAESGDISALCATWVGPNGGVMLVEPSPWYWPCIRTTFQENLLDVPVRSFVGFAAAEMTMAGMDQAGVVERRWPDAAYTSGPLDREGFSAHWERPDIPSVTIDYMASGYRVDVITMDIEGAELLALRGAEQTLREQKPLVYVSVHPDEFMAPYGYDQADLWQFMYACGYDTFHITDDHESHWIMAHPEGRKVVHP